MPCRARPRRPDERGAALITVLLFAGLIAAIGLAVLAEGRSAAAISRNAITMARARALADAGAQYAIAALVQPAHYPDLRLNGTPFTVEFAGETLELTIQDAFGLVDLNMASPATLERLLAGIGVSPIDATRTAAAIADWRDGNDKPRTAGAERGDYLAAHTTPLPANRTFHAVSELHQVHGIDQDIYARIEPHLTVLSGQAQIDVNSAPLQLVQMLGSTSAVQVRRAQLERPQTYEHRSLVGHAFHIKARVVVKSGTTFRAELSVRLTGSPEKPLVIHRWKRHLRAS